MAPVSTDGTNDVGPLGALVIVLWAIETKVANGPTYAAALLGHLDSETIHRRKLLHAVRPRILELWALWREEWIDQLRSCLDLLLCVALNVHMGRHLQLLICLELVTDISAPDENPTSRNLLQPFVIDSTRAYDYAHKGLYKGKVERLF